MSDGVDSPDRDRWHAGCGSGMQRIRRIKAGNKASPARLSRDHASGRVCVALRCQRCLSTGAIGASVNVADLHPALLVNGHVKEVEEIAANIGAAVHPNATTLHRILGCHVGSGPVLSSIECAGHVKMPDTIEAVRRTIARCGRTVEGDCGAASLGCYCRRESNVLETINCAYIVDVLPCLTAISRCSDDGIRTAGRAPSHCAT